MTPSDTPVPIKRVLVLEDNFIIALEAEDILLSLGVEHVDIATTLTEANQFADAQPYDFALLDVNLGNETSFLFADTLIARGIRIGFVTGYGDVSIFPAHLRPISRLSKPFNEASISRLLSTTTGLAV